MSNQEQEENGVLSTRDLIEMRRAKPSQTCYQCLMQQKKSLFERWHQCPCGASCDRDENAARVILNWALRWVSG